MTRSLSSSFSLLTLMQRLIWLCLLVVVSSCTSNATIVNGLTEREANEILVFLDSRGIQADKERDTSGGAGGGANKLVMWNVVVPATRAAEAMSILNSAGLPRRPSQNLLGIFKESGLVPSEMQEKIKYQAGLGEQIASTLRKIDGVVDAEVQLSFPEEDPLNPGQMKGKVTASVYVKHTGVLDDPNKHLVSKIRQLVASSVNGLNYDDVTVIGDRARYSDFGPEVSGANVEEKALVSVWSLVLAKESVTRFRVIFFSFFVAILLLLLLLVWVSWKTWPIIQKHGNLHRLFSLEPLVPPEGETKEESAAESTPPQEGENNPEDNKSDQTGTTGKPT